MKKIFIGFLIVFFEFNFNLGQSTIGLIPDFLGYYFILEGLKSYSDKNWFYKSKIIIRFLFSVSSIIYILNIFGLLNAIAMIPIFGSIILYGYELVTIYGYYIIAKEIKSTGEGLNSIKESEDMILSSYVRLVVLFIMMIFGIIGDRINIFTVFAIVISFVAFIFYLVSLYKIKEKEEKRNEEIEKIEE